MVKFITTFCIEFMDRSTVKCGDAELSARQIFAKTINRAVSQGNVLNIVDIDQFRIGRQGEEVV
jgi:hypothetical protein